MTTATKARWAAFSATVLAFLGAYGVAIQDGVVTGQEWVAVAIATVTALGGVFGVTYAAPANQPKGDL